MSFIEYLSFISQMGNQNPEQSFDFTKDTQLSGWKNGMSFLWVPMYSCFVILISHYTTDHINLHQLTS